MGRLLLLLAQVAAAGQPAPEAFVLRRASLDLTADYRAERLSGSVTYELENWTAAPAGAVSFLLGRLLEVSAVRDGAGNAVAYTQDVTHFHDEPVWQVTQVVVALPGPVPPGGRTTLRLEYGGNLVGYTEVGWLYVRDHIDSAFTILRVDALAFPDIGGLSSAANRRRPRPDFAYDAAVRVPAGELVATGGSATRTLHDDGTVTWRYVSSGPSPFLNIAIAPFDTVASGSVRVFFFPADSAGARRVLAQAGAALDTLTRWFGPLRAVPSVTIAEIPDGWGSQASLVGGIIQTASAFRDPERVGELYHELSHLWNVRDRDDPSPRWNEGLATFLQELLRERVDGWTGRGAAERDRIAALRRRLAADTLLARVPFSDYGARAMTGRAYSVGGLMFATLYDLLGQARFDRLIGGYYQRFADGGTTRDFVAFARHAAPGDLGPFFDDWIFTTRWTTLLADAGSVRDLARHYRGR